MRIEIPVSRICAKCLACGKENLTPVYSYWDLFCNYCGAYDSFEYLGWCSCAKKVRNPDIVCKVHKNRELEK